MKAKQIMVPVSRIFHRIFHWIVSPPYFGVPWLVWLYAVLSLFTYSHGTGVLTGHLIGFDDKVRMTQVLNWVNGAGWYDRVITRANPPGFETIWTRIVDIPIAAVVMLGQIFVDQKTAALIASVVVPSLELAVLFLAARYFARPLVGRNNARLIVLFMMFTSVLNQKRYTLSGFHPGEAGHHSWYIILNAMLFGAAARLALGVRGAAPALILAGTIALMLAVGIEGYPMIAGIAAILGAIAWCFSEPMIAKRGALAVALGAFFTLMLLPLHQPPARLFDVSFSQPSILGPILVGAAAVFLALEYLILRRLHKRMLASLLSLFLLAGFIGLLLIRAFPQILDGPAAALSPAERAMAFNEHPEAWPMVKVSVSKLDYLGLIMPTLIALVSGVVAMRGTASRRRRMLYASYFGCVVLSGGMAEIFWRYYHHAMTAACAWLVWAWNALKRTMPRNKNYSLKALISFVALGPFWMLFLPALEMDAPISSQVLFFPVKIQTIQDKCDVLSFADYLNAHYAKNTVISVPDWDSAEFLYYTNLTIDFLSNYPSQDRFLDTKSFYQTTNPEVAKAIAARHGFDLVSICRQLPVSPESRHAREPMFMERLRDGPIPSWLKPVNTGLATYYLLFEVDKSALKERER
jgi:hypothetical protein